MGLSMEQKKGPIINTFPGGNKGNADRAAGPQAGSSGQAGQGREARVLCGVQSPK